jgi:hypothetical protein
MSLRLTLGGQPIQRSRHIFYVDRDTAALFHVSLIETRQRVGY